MYVLDYKGIWIYIYIHIIICSYLIIIRGCIYIYIQVTMMGYIYREREGM